MKIGVFDSGIGGITVLVELRKRFPGLNYVYLGDTANVPYGPKSPGQIEKLAVQGAQLLKNKGVDALVVACNTICSWALPVLRDLFYPTPVIDVIEPGVSAALRALSEWSPSRPSQSPLPVLVLATRATIRSHSYRVTLEKHLSNPSPLKPQSISLLEQACPLLVPLIEEGWVRHPVLSVVISEYVKPYFEKYPPGVAILGCTHYPWIHQSFEKELPGWKVVNSAWAVVEALERSHWFKSFEPRENGSHPRGSMEWIFTDPEAISPFIQQSIDSFG